MGVVVVLQKHTSCNKLKAWRKKNDCVRVEWQHRSVREVLLAEEIRCLVSFIPSIPLNLNVSCYYLLNLKLLITERIKLNDPCMVTERKNTLVVSQLL